MGDKGKKDREKNKKQKIKQQATRVIKKEEKQKTDSLWKDKNDIQFGLEF
jgi:hypothetical protein